ncbi:hypothetical protein ABZ345_35035 [Lentzea sp. NPDC005914]|uniref:hypothetical protein n=1 Tax=Lentzea sp. NPDC005914 TaxID=3154572 RepID=UPI0033D1FAC9
MGLRKVLLAVAVSLSALIVTPAQAAEPCPLWERQVFAITASGGLVEHAFCLDADRTVSRWVRENVVATSGWDNVSTAFWSGEVYGVGVYYRVIGPALYWSGDLVSWQRIGATTDWSRFTSLISTQPGVIYAVEPSGAVRRLTHLGWQNGADTWAGSVAAGNLPGGSVLLGHPRDGFAALTSAGLENVVTVWSDDFGVVKLRITVPVGVDPASVVPFDLQQKYRNSGFGLTSAGKLVVLLPINCGKLKRDWRADDETGGGYRKIFGGGYQQRGVAPVEWQCAGPGGPAN